MSDIILIVKMIYYFVFVFGLFLYARYKYKKDKGNKFGLVALVFFAILFGVYSVICGPPGESIGDRHNYALRFEDVGYEQIVKDNSIGLYAVESFLHLFTTSSSVLFFTISVLFFCINIYCYKKLDDATPFYLLLFFLSTIGIFGLYALKQAMSLTFVNLALTKYFQNKKVWAIVALIIALLFHEAAWVVVPCFILARFCKGSKLKQAFIYSVVIVLAVLFPQISKIFVSVFSHIPGMSSQIGSYVDDSGSMLIDMNYFTIVKGLPYYIISVVAISCRRYFRNKINNYDFLMVLSVFCSIFSILSMYMYWMFRFAMYCYIACFILASQLALHLQERNGKIFRVAVVGALMFLMIKLLAQYYFVYGGIV